MRSACVCVCVCVRVCVCAQNISKSYDRILVKFFGGLGRGQRTNRLEFGGDPGHNPGPGFLHPDHDPRRRYVLCPSAVKFVCFCYLLFAKSEHIASHCTLT